MIIVIVTVAVAAAAAAAVMISEGFSGHRGLNERLAGLIGHQCFGAFQQHILEVLSCGGIGDGRHVYRAKRAAGESYPTIADPWMESWWKINKYTVQTLVGINGGIYIYSK